MMTVVHCNLPTASVSSQPILFAFGLLYLQQKIFLLATITLYKYQVQQDCYVGLRDVAYDFRFTFYVNVYIIISYD